MKTEEKHMRECWDCKTVNEHESRITPGVCCPKCGSQDTRWIRPPDPVDGPADGHDLEALGFTGGADEPGTDVYEKRLGAAGCGPILRIWIEYRRGEQVKSGMGLHWEYCLPTNTISMAFAIRDNPTAGDVRRLLAELDPK